MRDTTVSSSDARAGSSRARSVASPGSRATSNSSDRGAAMYFQPSRLTLRSALQPKSRSGAKDSA
ncbi:MAG: hypothetical protein ACRD1S_11825 [Vicinamibacterales bacterium]